MSNGYHWQRPELEQRCSQWQISAEGSVVELRDLPIETETLQNLHI